MNDQSFASLGLSESILSTLKNEGYETPTPIQAASIPSLLAGKDLLGCAQTGTGKTAAFALPIIQLLVGQAARSAPRGCRALIVAPTRELAAQIDQSFEAYGRGSRLSRACVFGGVGKSPQVKALGRGVDILTATPGRLLDLHSEGQLRLDHVSIVVLDEADRMLDMGFIKDVRRIMSLIPAKRQTLLFSATMPQDIAGLASSVLKDPVRVAVSPEKPTVELIDQKVAYVEKGDKRAFLAHLIKSQDSGRAIVFTRTKHGADRLVKGLGSSGIAAAAIHANKSQNNRIRTMDGFRSGEIRVLVATDLAARGIDVDGISHVYNYELPEVPETYVHRIGRTARAGASGEAIALCDSEEKPLLRAIEKLLRKPVPLASGPVFDDARAAAAADRGSIASKSEAAHERPRYDHGSRAPRSGARGPAGTRLGVERKSVADRPPRSASSKKKSESGLTKSATDRNSYSSSRKPGVDRQRSSAPVRGIQEGERRKGFAS